MRADRRYRGCRGVLRRSVRSFVRWLRQYVTNKHDFGYFIQPWKDEFLRMPFDVTKRKKWADYVAERHATGKEIDYDNYDWDK